MRNIIAHSYLEIDMNEVWKTVSEDVPTLLHELHELAVEIWLDTLIDSSAIIAFSFRLPATLLFANLDA